MFGVYVDALLTKLKMLGIGCYVGDVFCGALGYADDLELLVPTLQSLKKMITVCEDYAASFNIIFNGNKSLLMIFGKSIECNVFVCGQCVKVVKDMKHLGHVITDDINDTLIKPIVNDFNVKFNTFLAYFNDVRCDVKSTLFKQYCTSFYGSHVCALYDKDVENLYVSLRNAIRKVRQLPVRAHCRLLPHVCDMSSPKVMFYKRFIKHFMSGFHSKNEMVRTVFRSSLFNMSRLGKNFRHVCFENNINVWNVDLNTIGSKSIMFVFENEDERVGAQVKELCIERDRISEWVLDRI